MVVFIKVQLYFLVSRLEQAEQETCRNPRVGSSSVNEVGSNAFFLNVVYIKRLCSFVSSFVYGGLQLSSAAPYIVTRKNLYIPNWIFILRFL